MKKKNMYFIVLCLIFTNSVMCMQQKTMTIQVFTKVIPEDKATDFYVHYLNECFSINRRQEQKLQELIKKSNRDTCENDIKRCDSVLADVLSKMSSSRLECENNIRKSLAISEETWAKFKSFVKNLKMYENNQKHLFVDGVSHDKAVPKGFKNIIEVFLVQKGINPQRVNIFFEKGLIRVSSGSPHYNTQNEAFPSVKKQMSPYAGEITLFDVTVDYKKQITLAKLYAHAMDRKKNLFLGALHYCASDLHLTSKKLNRNRYYGEYRNAIWAGAIISLACHNPQDACALYALCADFPMNGGNATSISLYEELSRINKYWNYRDWLRSYSSLRVRLISKKDCVEESLSS